MLNAELIRDLLRQESQQKVYVSGIVSIEGKEHQIFAEVKSVRSAQHESFNDGKKLVRLVF